MYAPFRHRILGKENKAYASGKLSGALLLSSASVRHDSLRELEVRSARSVKASQSFLPRFLGIIVRVRATSSTKLVSDVRDNGRRREPAKGSTLFVLFYCRDFSVRWMDGHVVGHQWTRRHFLLKGRSAAAYGRVSKRFLPDGQVGST